MDRSLVEESPSKKESREEKLAVADGFGVRTYFVFLDLPYHCEHRVGSQPLLPPGTEIEVEARLSDQRTPGGVRDVRGSFRVSRQKLVYSTKRPGRMGLTQYLELLQATGPPG